MNLSYSIVSFQVYHRQGKISIISTKYRNIQCIKNSMKCYDKDGDYIDPTTGLAGFSVHPCSSSLYRNGHRIVQISFWPTYSRSGRYHGICRLHRNYLKQEHPARHSCLILTGKLWTYLADLNEQAEERMDLIIEQMKAAEGVTEELKAQNQFDWVGQIQTLGL